MKILQLRPWLMLCFVFPGNTSLSKEKRQWQLVCQGFICYFTSPLNSLSLCLSAIQFCYYRDQMREDKRQTRTLLWMWIGPNVVDGWGLLEPFCSSCWCHAFFGAQEKVKICVYVCVCVYINYKVYRLWSWKGDCKINTKQCLHLPLMLQWSHYVQSSVCFPDETPLKSKEKPCTLPAERPHLSKDKQTWGGRG